MNQRAILHDDDIVVFTAATVHAVYAAVLQVYNQAKARVAANGPAWTDDDGVVHERQYRLTFAEVREDLTVKQRRFLHGPVLGQIAEQVRMPDGSRYVAAIWKEYFRKLYLPDRWASYRMPGAKRATPHRVRVSTEDLSIKQYSELIDKVLAHATTELGVVFDLNPQEREEVRYRRPSKRRAAQSIAEEAKCQ